MKKINTLRLLTPILNLESDHRYGQSPGQWALYQTPEGWYYLGHNDPEGKEYILPLCEDTAMLLQQIVQNNDTVTSIVEQLYGTLENGDEELAKATAAFDHGDAMPDVEEADQLLIMTPSLDKVFGDGPEIKGHITQQGVPYILSANHLICFDALTFRVAFSLLEQDALSEIQPAFDEQYHPGFLITQNERRVHFHLTDVDLSGIDTEQDNIIHATPLALCGMYDGKRIEIKHQG